MHTGQSTQLAWQMNPIVGKHTETWITMNDKVASVDRKGNVTAFCKGHTNIVLTLDVNSTASLIDVEQKVDLSPDKLHLSVAQSSRCVCKVILGISTGT